LAAAAQASQSTYFYAFWSVTGISMCLGFVVFYEVLVIALKPFSAVTDLARIIFAWAALFLLVTAALTAVATNGPHTAKICAAVELMERSVQLVQCGLLLLLLIFQNRFGLSWRHQGMAVALGLGISSSVGLTASYVESSIPAWAGTADLLDGWLRAAV